MIYCDDDTFAANFPYICNNTTNAIKLKLNTNTVVGPIFNPGASSV